MGQISLAELRLRTRERADMVNSKFVKDSELTFMLNQSAAELYDLLLESYGSEYFVQLADEFLTVTDQKQYDLPSDFYELKAVDMRVGPGNSEWYTLKRFNFNERNRFDSGNMAGLVNTRYRIVGNQIMFTPLPDPGTACRIWYSPTSPMLVNDTDTLDALNGYDEYIIVDAAIKCMQKEESDVSVLMAQKQALMTRIVRKSQNRDANEAPTISDIDATDDDFFFLRRS